MRARAAAAASVLIMAMLLAGGCALSVAPSRGEETTAPSGRAPTGAVTSTPRESPSPGTTEMPSKPTPFIGPLPAVSATPTDQAETPLPGPSRATVTPAAAAEGPVAASSFAALRSLDSFALETVVLVETSAGTAESIDAVFKYSAPTRSEHLVLSGETLNGEPTRTEIVQIGERTFVAQDDAEEWQEVDGTLRGILAALNLEWLVEPQALLGESALLYKSTERVLGSLADRYEGDVGLLQRIPAFGELRGATGRIDVWASTRYNTVIQLIAEAEGRDAAGSPVLLRIETTVTSVGEPVDITVPVPIEVPTPSPLPVEAKTATVSLDELLLVEDLPSYRMYIYFVEHGRTDVTAEVMRRFQAEPLRDHLVTSARAGERTAWSEMRQVDGVTWVDNDGTGAWEETDTAIADIFGVQDVLPEDIFAPLSRTSGVLVGEELAFGMPTERYHWTRAQVTTELGAQEIIQDARADAWISTEYDLPIQVVLYMQSETGRLLVQYVVTGIGDQITVLPPAESFCPAARSIQVNQMVSGEVAPGEATCFKFIALEGERLTLAMEVAEDADFDAQITVYDDEGRIAHHNDDGPEGYTPLLSFAPRHTAVYYAVVSGFGADEAGAFDLALTFFDETTTATFDTAERLETGIPVSGTITEETLVLVEHYDQTVYGRAYAFSAQEGQVATITVLAESVGSDLDPQVFLFGPRGEPLAHDDDGYGGLDSQLTYEVTETGDYYIVVNHASGAPYGTRENYFYELTLEID